MGAKCTTNLSSEVTHVISAQAGLKKIKNKHEDKHEQKQKQT